MNTRSCSFLLWSAACLLLPTLAQAATVHVPADYTTLQAAVDAAATGDTVLVADGTYSGDGNRDVDFGGKNLIVTSQNGANSTIIDCGGTDTTAHRGFYFHSGETVGSVVSGFTLRNANGPNEGAVFVDAGSGATIQGCLFQNNTSDGSGAGLYNSGTLTLQNCTFSGNTTSGDFQSGAGLYSDGDATLQNCVFTGNTAANYGGAIAVNAGTATATNCVFAGNTASLGGAIFSFGDLTLVNCSSSANISDGALYNGGTAVLTNDIFFGDSSDEIIGTTPTATYCDIAGGPAGTGNRDSDPQFVSGSVPYDLHLQGTSPCLGTGTDSGAPATDADGNARPHPPSIGAYDRTGSVAPPTGLTATSGAGEVTLNWTAPPGTVSSYSLYRGTAPGGETLYKSGITNTSFVNATVTAGTTYYYTVKTVSGGQTSVASSEVSGTPTGIAVPGTPTNLKAVPGDAKVTLTWTASTGTVSSYTVYRGTSASALAVYKTGITATSFVNGLLTNGTTYYYSVAAVNSGGSSPQSSVVSATPIAIPAAPTNLTAAAGIGKVTLTWTAPAGIVTSYSVYRGTSSGSEVFYNNPGTATTFVDASGTVGTKYYYTVRANNGSGTGAASNEVSATPARMPVPGTPTNLKAVPGDAKVTLTWTASTGTVSSYTVYRGTSASALTAYKTGITATSFSNGVVTNGTTYYYSVAAVNSGGSSPQSSVVSATPIAIPAAPTHLTATASGGKVTLAWTAPAGIVSYYSVYRATTPGGETLYKSGITNTTFVNATVTVGTKYYYTVRATNGSGTGSMSGQVSATP